ncbi:hypothetical protein PTKIN_Ptkin04bG0074700 [Pterospermum kingtungense]
MPIALEKPVYKKNLTTTVKIKVNMKKDIRIFCINSFVMTKLERWSARKTCRVASFPKEMIRKWELEDGPLEMAMKSLKNNKGVVISVVIAFSIGLLPCRTFESNGELGSNLIGIAVS